MPGRVARFRDDDARERLDPPAYFELAEALIHEQREQIITLRAERDEARRALDVALKASSGLSVVHAPVAADMEAQVRATSNYRIGDAARELHVTPNDVRALRARFGLPVIVKAPFEPKRRCQRDWCQKEFVPSNGNRGAKYCSRDCFQDRRPAKDVPPPAQDPEAGQD